MSLVGCTEQLFEVPCKQTDPQPDSDSGYPSPETCQEGRFTSPSQHIEENPTYLEADFANTLTQQHEYDINGDVVGTVSVYPGSIPTTLLQQNYHTQEEQYTMQLNLESNQLTNQQNSELTQPCEQFSFEKQPPTISVAPSTISPTIQYDSQQQWCSTELLQQNHQPQSHHYTHWHTPESQASAQQIDTPERKTIQQSPSDTDTQVYHQVWTTTTPIQKIKQNEAQIQIIHPDAVESSSSTTVLMVSLSSLSPSPSLSSNSSVTSGTVSAEPTVVASDLRCHLCQKTFDRQASRTQHINTVHSDSENLCLKCGKRFKTVERLDYHIASHSRKNKPYPCDICEKEYIHKTDLLRHQDGHNSNGKRFKCNPCGVGFSRFDQFKKHKTTRKHQKIVAKQGKVCDQ
ncbi:myoneurin-like [Toxorhynchites rutilus septentrionalis]|uniref:myoneurin-like n=1 Tax=Toxorhynchites rutilus septentrionalis TaxID=329112 RepID=UPI00247AA6B5|nr:myoneurin-like [Toxorhynchites rutilus septentrionalis]XP_055642142.1 myoneurin-like [Toxorhynchites rutilus septentrionalis]